MIARLPGDRRLAVRRQLSAISYQTRRVGVTAGVAASSSALEGITMGVGEANSNELDEGEFILTAEG
jgi:hypothetical protein